MKIIDAPIAVLRLQYRVARFPLQLIEDRVVSRMGSEAPARLFYERSLGLLDAAVGGALGDARLRARGSALADRSDALGRAAQLDATAAQAREQSGADLKAKHDKAVEERREASAAKQREVEDALNSAEQKKREVDEAAAERTAAAKKQADDIAARRANSVEEAKRDEQTRIRAEEQVAAAAAKSKLDDAQAARNEADVKRTQADRVEDLADAEKRKRQAARAQKD